MSLVCFAFVVQAGHRATRLERLTFGSLFSSSRVLSIFDKDDTVGQRAQPRLVPVTKAIHDLLAAAIECHAIAQRAGSRGSTGAAESVFVYWSDDGMATPVRTAHIALHAREFFTSDVNFGRSQWVTSLDRDGVDRWLIRALTGHARDVSRTVGAYFDVPPLVAADRLREAMETTGHKIFGPATVQHSGRAWKPCGLTPASFDVRPAQPGEKGAGSPHCIAAGQRRLPHGLGHGRKNAVSTGAGSSAGPTRDTCAAAPDLCRLNCRHWHRDRNSGFVQDPERAPCGKSLGRDVDAPPLC